MAIADAALTQACRLALTVLSAYPGQAGSPGSLSGSRGSWRTSDGRIVLLTVFRKTRQHEQRQIDRAVRAQKTCERETHAA